MNSAATIYLASASPRRREILAGLGFAVRTCAVAIDETPQPQEAARDYVLRMAVEKNRAARTVYPEYTPLLAADTSVVAAGRILGKPESPEEAEAMLAALSGRSHSVLTAVCVWNGGRECAAVQESRVDFAVLSEKQIAAYVAGGEPLDKAGAYGIQGLGGMFVRHLSGSFSGVMGLPVYETVHLLQECGCAVPPFQGFQAA